MANQAPPMALARFAEVVAHEREYRKEVHATLWERLKTSEDLVYAARAYWSRKIGDEIARGDPTLAARFAGVYVKVRRSVGLRHPPLQDIEPDSSLSDSEDIEEPAVVEARTASDVLESGGPSVAREVPTYLKPPPKHKEMQANPMPVTPAEDPFSGTAMLPQPAELLQRIRESDPRVAIAKAAHLAPPAKKLEDLPDSPGETLPTGTVALQADAPRAATPFESARLRPEDVDLSMFPLEKYAEISGAIGGGEPREQVLARHKLSASLYDTLATAWARQFEKDPSLVGRFTEIARRSAKSGEKKA